jgi:hypothetical protein
VVFGRGEGVGARQQSVKRPRSLPSILYRPQPNKLYKVLVKLPYSYLLQPCLQQSSKHKSLARPRNFVFIPSFYLASPILRSEGDIKMYFKETHCEVCIECLGYWHISAISNVVINERVVENATILWLSKRPVDSPELCCMRFVT